MAKRNILMKKKNGTAWDELYPITTANNVKVSSISGLAGTDVQSCLQNLFTFADNGKKNIATVIGSPLSTSDTFDSMKNKIQTMKNTFASNLTAKGQSSSGSDTLNNLINKIVNINTGKKWATGNININAEYGYGTVTVSNLSFKPSYIITYVNYPASDDDYDERMYERVMVGTPWNKNLMLGCHGIFEDGSTTGMGTDSSRYTLTNDGFIIKSLYSPSFATTSMYICFE